MVMRCDSFFSFRFSHPKISSPTILIYNYYVVIYKILVEDDSPERKPKEENGDKRRGALSFIN